jgi:uncharacterized Zn-finger protein
MDNKNNVCSKNNLIINLMTQYNILNQKIDKINDDIKNIKIIIKNNEKEVIKNKNGLNKINNMINNMEKNINENINKR